MLSYMLEFPILTSKLAGQVNDAPTLPRLPDLRILLVIIPLYLQAWLLVVEQDRKTRFRRIILVPFGLYLAGNFARYNFEPYEGFRA